MQTAELTGWWWWWIAVVGLLVLVACAVLVTLRRHEARNGGIDGFDGKVPTAAEADAGGGADRRSDYDGRARFARLEARIRRVTYLTVACVTACLVTLIVGLTAGRDQIHQLDQVQQEQIDSRVESVVASCRARNRTNEGILDFIADSPRPDGVPTDVFNRRLIEALRRAREKFPVVPDCGAYAQRTVKSGG